MIKREKIKSIEFEYKGKNYKVTDISFFPGYNACDMYTQPDPPEVEDWDAIYENGVKVDDIIMDDDDFHNQLCLGCEGMIVTI